MWRSWITIPEETETMVTVPTHRPPTHPGEMLLEEFLEPLGMTQTDLAERIEVPFQRVNSLVNGRRALTPDTALRLSRLFGTTPGFWMSHQLRCLRRHVIGAVVVGVRRRGALGVYIELAIEERTVEPIRQRKNEDSDQKKRQHKFP